jgi:hypothetical protein
MSKSTKKAENTIQIDRFKEAARQLEVDENEAAFDEKLKALAKQKPQKPTITIYQAIVSTGDPEGVHKRLSIEATDLVSAKAKLETEFGIGAVVSLWGDWESAQSRNAIGREK